MIHRDNAALSEIVRSIALPLRVSLRAWREDDFPTIQILSHAEGWTTPSERPDAARQSWRAAWPALVAAVDGQVIGFMRAISDGAVTTYVAELLVAPPWRGQGIALARLDVAQAHTPGARLDLLATARSRAFYEHRGFRPFAGFRRSWDERF